MPNPRWSIIAAVGIAAVFALACGPKPDGRLDRRVAACEKYCAALTDRTCPIPTNDPEAPEYFASQDECMIACADPTSTRGTAAYWVYIDGQDVCYEDAKAYYSCVGGLSCEGLQTFAVTTPESPDRPCATAEQAAIECHRVKASNIQGG